MEIMTKCFKCNIGNVRLIALHDLEKEYGVEEYICEKCWDKTEGKKYGYYFDRNGCHNEDNYEM